LRGQGTVTTSHQGAGGFASARATITVSGEPLRSEPSGAIPPVTVIRIRARCSLLDSTTAIAPAVISSRSGDARPSPAADLPSLARCRVSANGTPLTTLIVSKTPSPVTSP
jgi:hypothetical protein